MDKRLYTGFSLIELIGTLFLRLAALFGLIYSLAYFDENPVVISVAALFCLLIVVFIGDDQIVVYPDKVIQTTNSLSSLIFRNTGTIYKIEDIKIAYLQPIGSATEFAGAFLLASLLPKQNYDRSRPIFLDLKSGETVRIATNLGREKMKTIVKTINNLVN